ncbi:hypothetical protein B0H34DRAFT_200362 [Crassisporium funariophilum]|nr:hypothetical protein B0H34DRAFT_200362 [Crassisporium funariophilum]
MALLLLFTWAPISSLQSSTYTDVSSDKKSSPTPAGFEPAPSKRNRSYERTVPVLICRRNHLAIAPWCFCSLELSGPVKLVRLPSSSTFEQPFEVEQISLKFWSSRGTRRSG